MNKSTLLATLAAAILVTGCARFHTRQIDTFTSTAPSNGNTNQSSAVPGLQTRTTEVSAWTLFSAKSQLTKFKARQADASQQAEVGELSQQGGTNTVATLQALAALVGALPK